MIESFVKKVSGTAGEALEMHELQRLIELYKDPVVVQGILAKELEQAGESWETLTIYRRFKQKVQRDEISFMRAGNEAKAAAREDLRNLGLRSS